MERYNDDTIILTREELNTIKKYKKLESLKELEKKDNTYIIILGFMTAIIAVFGIGTLALLGSIYELLEIIGGVG